MTAAAPAAAPTMTIDAAGRVRPRTTGAIAETIAKTTPAESIAQTPAPAGSAIDTAPEARADLSPELAARVDQLRAATHTPEELAQMRAEDAITEQEAYRQMRAQEVIWGNRAAKADRYAKYIVANGLTLSPENIARATGELVEKDEPSPETLDMIRDRVDALRRGRALPAPEAAPAPAAETVEPWQQQLRDSVAAIESKRGEPRAAEAQVPGPAPAGGRTLDTGGTRGRSETTPPDTAIPGTARGDKTEVLIPGERGTYPATYAVKKLADVQPSHLGETFQPNPDYTLKNDRNYDDPRNQRKIIDWSVKAGFEPRNMLNTAPDASSGPPVIDAEGNVLGGNGRSMILQRVFKSNPDGAAAYRAELDRTAAHYGINPADYAHMKQPVLVRELAPEVNEPATLQRAITDFNKVGTAALTPAERAIADSRGVSLRTLDDIAARMDKHGADATLAQTLEGRAGVEVLENLTRDGVISPQEQAELSTGAKLTKTGKDRISGLMLGRFFENAKQLDALPDSLRNKMERIAAPLARAEAIPGYELSGRVREALNLIEDSDAHGAETLDDFLAQRGLFSEHQYSADAIALARAIKNRNPVALTNAVRAYATRAKYAQEFQGEGMFKDIPQPLKPAAAFAESFAP